MGSSQSSAPVLFGEILATGLVLIAGAYFLSPPTKNEESKTPSKSALKNKKKKEKKSKITDGEPGTAPGLQSSIDTLVAEDSDAAVASSSKVTRV